MKMQNEYPRPQMRRSDWQSLNGEWLCNGAKCNVPECRTEERLSYSLSFDFARSNDVVLLHFGAVDQIAEVRLNGAYLGRHIGGYLSFSFDVSHAIRNGSNTLEVDVTDRLDNTYPYGKQRKDRGGMWYTPVSGIWQTVWIEQLPEDYIESVKITPDLSGVDVDMHVVDGGIRKTISERISVENPELWTPDNPKLYTRKLKFKSDEVEIYFALRTIDIVKIDGINRVCLNGKPIFMHGVLDQGYFEDGVFMPSDPREFENDVMRVKALGFNMIRKHIKIEPEIFYYSCDRLGMLVIQDMVNSGEYSFARDTAFGTAASIINIRYNDRRGVIDERKRFWVKHSLDTIEQLYNHPCIVAWTLFNEGWGQFCADAMYDRAKAADSTRLVDATSGWFAQRKSDFDSEHVYFRTKTLRPGERPLLLSECGGYSLNLGGRNDTYGYGACKDSAELSERIANMYEKMVIPAIEKGLCGCVYTQVSDIEDEINGLYSYDRSTCKVDAGKMLEIAEKIRKNSEARGI